ncbi:proton-conducting transporter transmembrane domain-containing protein [Larkinella arboricola]
MESAVLIFTALSSFGVFLFRAQTKYFFSLFLHTLLIVTASSWAFRALSTGGLMQFNLLELAGFNLSANIDSLSAFFLTIISLTLLIGLLYANGYLKLYRKTLSDVRLSLHHLALLWLHISLILVNTLREGTAFLSAWELMTVSAFGLVVFEAERKEILKTGFKYLLQMQIGLALIATAFLIAKSNGSVAGFETLDAYFGNHGSLPVFFLFFVGFGIYAGFAPLHTWLPPTHLTAPSHVSSIMSSILTQMGIYGILRVLVSVHTDLFPVGLLILTASFITAFVGLRYTFMQQDGKRLLAYSSITHTGIIGIGIGIGVLGLAFHTPALAALGFTGGILHILTHALSKSLLFQCIGSIYRATRTRHLEQLGGLMQTMPKTSMLFSIGLLALCGIPPLTISISETLLYAGLLKGLTVDNSLLHVLIWTVLLSLTFLISWSMFGFIRVFRRTFLDAVRSEAAAQATEVSDDMILPKAIAGLSLLLMGLFPNVVLKLATQVTALFVTDLHSLDDIAPVLTYLGIGGVALAGFLLWTIKFRGKIQKPVSLNYRRPNTLNKPNPEPEFG